MTVPLPAEQPVLRIVPMPADTNAHGTIFGGWVMAQVDIAGSIPAWERAHAFYLQLFADKGYSDIQDQSPVPLEELENEARPCAS